MKLPSTDTFCPAEHLDRARHFHSSYERKNDFSLLPHAALELRLAIEQILQAYVMLAMAGTRRDLDFDLPYSAKDLRRQILGMDPLIFVKAEFFENLDRRMLGVKNSIIPDLDYLCEVYGKLGNLLHAQRIGDSKKRLLKWWLDMGDLLRECIDYLQKLISRPLVNLFMDDHKEVLSKYMERKITKADALARMKSGWGLNPGVVWIDLK